MNSINAFDQHHVTDSGDSDIARLGPWFHNLHLPNGSQTAPQHELGDFPSFKWRKVAAAVPQDLSGWSVLDIGCNAGYYSFELAKRGAQVTGVDIDEHYLAQARWAARRMGLDAQVQFKFAQVYELAHWQERYDLVWFTGVFYHLRYPVLALDIIRTLTKRMMMFQSLTMPGTDDGVTPANIGLDDRDLMLAPAWPKMAFIEQALAGDRTNWWAPSHTCVEALLRTSGFEVIDRPEHEFYLCTPVQQPCLAEYNLVWSGVRS
jgi:tRNA (mo5U34)-methyltransferase